RKPKTPSDIYPEPPVSILPPPPQHVVRRVILWVRDRFQTVANRFGLYREYPWRRPTYDPESALALDELADYQPDGRKCVDAPPILPEPPKPPHPFANMSIWRLMNWANTGSSTKSKEEMQRLADILSEPDFDSAAFAGFNMDTQTKILDNSSIPFFGDDWIEESVEIEIPSGKKGEASRPFTVPGLHRRSLVSVIRSAFTEALGARFHFTPFFLRHISPDTGKTERVYSELYNSDAWIQEHEKLQKSPNNDGLEKVIAALMLWSDSTCLATFGTAKAWPLYMSFGNLSKYVRIQPSANAIHHLAYIPSLPDCISEFLLDIAKTVAKSSDKVKKIAAPLLTHCRRELMHAVLRAVFDTEFIHAYKHGIVIRCADGKERRVYPRIFTYSADYPEKVLLATIRDNGLCPCPRCFVKKSNFDEMGWVLDMRRRALHVRVYFANKIAAARRAIYELGRVVNGTAVDRILKEFSLTPTQNAFVDLLSPHGFNIFDALVVDLLHEFELGVWKAVFIHLIRVLFVQLHGPNLIAELNSRYRQVPPFSSTIRRFDNNASEMKKLAARDYEDLLQCSIPVFDRLLPEPLNTLVMTVLYRLCEWHALAKLRMHTDTTLELLTKATRTMGTELRRFRDRTRNLSTVELPKEVEARVRRENKTPGAGPASSSARPRFLNLLTYKFHALADYVPHIRLFGTTESYSTLIGEAAHRLVKQLYGRTNKRAAERQMTAHESRRRRLRRAGEAMERARLGGHPHPAALSDSSDPYVSFSEETRRHHRIVRSRSNSRHIRRLLAEHAGDPAVKDNILGRLRGDAWDPDTEFTEDERRSVIIDNNTIYSGNTLTVNYTTYDVRRDQDIVNIRTRPHVMLLSQDPNVKFWYAQVIGIFHAQVHYRNMSPKRMEFLWVRWYGSDPETRAPGSRTARLPKIGFVPEDDPLPFGFIDPSVVIRAAHIVPAFADGRTTGLLREGKSVGRLDGATDDWTNFFVMIFVDRDMYMRHIGGGIGHIGCTSGDNAGSAPKEDSPPEDNDGEDENIPELPMLDLSDPPVPAEVDGEDDEINEEDDDELGENGYEFEDDDGGDEGAEDIGSGEEDDFDAMSIDSDISHDADLDDLYE
ncbi:hypothetical protein DENSPDRAFT_780478, partial [Dentipellis sp. KUC8613]